MASESNRFSRREFLGTAIALGAAGAVVPRIMAAEAQGKPNWQIGCYTRPWAQWDWRVALDAIAEAGFKYAGLMTTKGGLIVSNATTPEQAGVVAEEVRNRKLTIASAWCGDIDVRKGLEAGIQSLRRMIDNCAIIGAGNLLMGGVGDAKLYDTYYKAIKECCDYAAEKKLGISVKPHGGLNSTGPQCRKTIEQVGNKNFGLWYDPGNIFYYSDGKIDPVDDSKTVDGIVVGMSVKDFTPPKEVDVTPGTGKVNFKTVMANLIKGGFTSGPLIVECLSRGDQPATLTEAKKARAFLEDLTGQKA